MGIFDLNGKVCIVTGSTQGIGRASAERMAEHGATVVVTSRTLADAEARARELNERFGKGRAVGLRFDLASRESGAELIENTVKACGRIDTLMCNAFYIKHGRLEAMSDDLDVLGESLEYNVRNYAYITKKAVPFMRQNGGGSIFYVLSTLGFFGSPPFVAYSVAKAALAHLTKILAVEYGQYNIRVNSLTPGSIDTSSKLQNDPDAGRIFVERLPLPRKGHVDEIAGMALLLASPAGAYATGQNFIFDGGQLLRGHEAAAEGYDAAMAKMAKQ